MSEIGKIYLKLLKEVINPLVEVVSGHADRIKKLEEKMAALESEQ